MSIHWRNITSEHELSHLPCSSCIRITLVHFQWTIRLNLLATDPKNLKKSSHLVPCQLRIVAHSFLRYRWETKIKFKVADFDLCTNERLTIMTNIPIKYEGCGLKQSLYIDKKQSYWHRQNNILPLLRIYFSRVRGGRAKFKKKILLKSNLICLLVFT